MMRRWRATVRGVAFAASISSRSPRAFFLPQLPLCMELTFRELQLAIS